MDACHVDLAALKRSFPGRIVLVFNGCTFIAHGNDAAVASRLAPSTRLHCEGRGKPLSAAVWYLLPLLKRAKDQGVAVAFHYPNGAPRPYVLGQRHSEMSNLESCIKGIRASAEITDDGKTVLYPPEFKRDIARKSGLHSD